MEMLIAAALVPIVFALIQFFIARPLGALAHKYLPEKVAEALTKKRFE